MIAVWHFALQVAASVADPGTPTLPACHVVPTRTQDERRTELHVACGKVGVWIGEAETSESEFNAALGSTFVVRHLGLRSYAHIIFPRGDGEYVVHDLSRDLTDLSGRYADAGLGLTAVDLRRFPVDGTIAVPALDASGKQTAEPAIFDAARYVLRTQMLLSSASPDAVK